MAHWAELDENNVVIRVTVGNNNDPVGDEGYSWIMENLGGRWIKTSYNGNIRKNFAGVGYKYDEALDAFIPPQPYPSWVLNSECNWIPPVAVPSDMIQIYPDNSITGTKFYTWNEDVVNWQENTGRTMTTVFEDSFIDE
jgi:hypothetical protein